jgi:hypothetical protein
MDDTELRRCHTARYKHRDPSVLIAAAAREWARRRQHATPGEAAA